MQRDPPHPLASVVVVTWNTAQTTVACVESVLANDPDRQLEVLVVDNASEDGTVDQLNRIDPRVTVIRNSMNEGFARACNQGMAAARAPFLVLLNSDTIIEDGVIIRSAQWLADHPGVGMVGCEIRDERGRRIYTANRRLSVRQSLFENLWLYRLMPAKNRAQSLLGGYWDGGQVDADWLVGAYLCLRREVFEQSDGFNPRFFMYGEDCEWGMRLKRSGVRIVFAPQIGTIVHRGAASSKEVWSTRERLRRGHEGGLRAYAMVHGDARSQVFRLAQLIGYTTRWALYKAANRARPSDYFADQATYYGWLRDFYLHPGEPADR
jgi:hypothetical protein